MASSIRFNRKSFSVKTNAGRIRFPYNKISKAIEAIATQGRSLSREFIGNAKFPDFLGLAEFPIFAQDYYDVLRRIEAGDRSVSPEEALEAAQQIQIIATPDIFEQEFWAQVRSYYGVPGTVSLPKLKEAAQNRKLTWNTKDPLHKERGANTDYARYKAWILDNIKDANYAVVMSATTAAQLNKWRQAYEVEGITDPEIKQQYERKNKSGNFYARKFGRLGYIK